MKKYQYLKQESTMCTSERNTHIHTRAHTRRHKSHAQKHIRIKLFQVNNKKINVEEKDIT